MHKTSAYLQHLAEICHTILYDSRWNNGLFSWEEGDDLSAVYPLAKLFLECDRKTMTYLEEQKTDDDYVARSMHLYSRLYHRKGPWFRIDDLFMRYYMKKNYKDDDITSTVSEHNQDESQAENKSCEKESKYPSTPFKCNQNNINNQKHTLDVKQKLEIFFQDIDHLLSIGLIRTFKDEIECGVVAGNDRMNGGILKSQERCTILSQLGGSIHNLKSKTKSPSNLQQPHLKRQKIMENNEILRQMKSQRSIYHSFASHDTNKSSSHHSPKSFLPIQCHLRSLILKNLCENYNDYIHSQDTNEEEKEKEKEQIYISSSVVNNACLQTNSMLHTKLSKSQISFLHDKKKYLSCIRLREKPLQTLRRFARLYIIATEGAGNMRLGAWLSIHDDLTDDKSYLKGSHDTSVAIGSPWYKVDYPGLKYRLRLQEYSFTSHYEPLICSSGNMKDKTNSMAQVFRRGMSEFKKWEISVEIRSTLDYLLAKYDLEKSSKRREIKEMKNNGDGISAPFYNDILELRTFLNISDSNVRLKLIKHLLSTNESSGTFQPWDPSHITLVENTTNAILFEVFGASFQDKSECCDTKENIMILCIISTLILHVRVHTMTQNDVDILIERPWLRHLRWEAVMALVVWDGIPIIEKNGNYRLAIFMLETILFGGYVTSHNTDLDLFDQKQGLLFFQKYVETTFTKKIHEENRKSFLKLLLPRRTRGKAIERYLIDRTHFKRNECKEITNSNTARRKQIQKKDNADAKKMCEKILIEEARKAAIPFSFIRNLARRLKRPLEDTMNEIWNSEMIELKIRIKADDDYNNKEPQSLRSEKDRVNKKKPILKDCYSDWVPITDHAVANSMNNEVGARCSFMGCEEESKRNIIHRSLNVEELALEEYASGRLPQNSSGIEFEHSGGWVGWHDEGGHVRALYRILCMENILGFKQQKDSRHAWEDWTIFLTPYQPAPMDLHVGYSFTSVLTHRMKDECVFAVRGFYERRRAAMENHLKVLKMMRSGDICRKIHETIQRRIYNCPQGKRTYVLLDNDVNKVKTLSMIACGLGGAAMASIFRCISFDYRHYCGGLPDLLLTKSLINIDENVKHQTVVPLEKWIGEAFTCQELHLGKANHVSNLLFDRDMEFLGCEQSSDTKSILSKRKQYNQMDAENIPKIAQDDTMSEASEFQELKMIYNGKNVNVHCLFVEVKSMNDRLDARQEDWLNILDEASSARVCKFEGKHK